jgi:hypothetical protein
VSASISSVVAARASANAGLQMSVANPTSSSNATLMASGPG